MPKQAGTTTTPGRQPVASGQDGELRVARFHVDKESSSNTTGDELLRRLMIEVHMCGLGSLISITELPNSWVIEVPAASSTDWTEHK
jgi:hypothetical protein